MTGAEYVHVMGNHWAYYPAKHRMLISRYQRPFEFSKKLFWVSFMLLARSCSQGKPAFALQLRAGMGDAQPWLKHSSFLAPRSSAVSRQTQCDSGTICHLPFLPHWVKRIVLGNYEK